MDIQEQLAQLNQARVVVEQDPAYYAQIVRGVLPVAQRQETELRQWLSEFLAQAFSSPLVAVSVKMDMSLAALDALEMLTTANDATGMVYKGIAQACATIYPLVLTHVIHHYDDRATWNKMTRLKSFLLRVWDEYDLNVKYACIKFAQSVVLAQSRAPPLTSATRRDEDDEAVNVSLNMIPTTHPFLQVSLLEAEGMGLLDRLTGTLHDKPYDVSSMLAVLNCLVLMAKYRPGSTANKIINSILGIDVTRMGFSRAVFSSDFEARCLIKTVKNCLGHILRANVAGTMVNRIHQYLATLPSWTRESMVHELKQKSGITDAAAPGAATSLVADMDVEHTPPPASVGFDLANSNIDIVDLYQVSAEPNPLAQFDVTQLPHGIASQIVFILLQHIQKADISRCIDIVRDKFLHLSPDALSGPTAPSAPYADIDEDDDYEPPDVNVDMINESVQGQIAGQDKDLSNLATFELGPPEDMDGVAIASQLNAALERLFRSEPRNKISTLSFTSALFGFGVGDWNQEKWIKLISLLPSQGFPGGQQPFQMDQDAVVAYQLSQFVRQRIFDHALDNFRERMDLALAWLTEEWYSDQTLASRYANNEELASIQLEPQYEHWTCKLLDSVIPFLEAKDRYITVFFSELPELTRAIISRLRKLCQDPDKARLGFLVVQYLISLRPPTVEPCLDLVEALYTEGHTDIKSLNEKILKRWRPAVVEREKAKLEAQVKEEATEHVKEEPMQEAQQEVKKEPNSATEPS